jgi:lipopolysaccharide/colanic/teichoic acid biosynthesis glycosyltransferase
MSYSDIIIKRSFDIALSFAGILLVWPVIFVTSILARLETGASGFFCQTRVGKGGRLFRVVKIRTMRPVGGTTVTVHGDARITPLGAYLRRWKLDELPQLWNVLKGDMSLVGPRPDVPGFMDKLQNQDRRLLTLRPGITGPATLKYRNENELLADHTEPERYNAEVIWPDKVRINLEYLDTWTLKKDVQYIIKTLRR